MVLHAQVVGGIWVDRRSGVRVGDNEIATWRFFHVRSGRDLHRLRPILNALGQRTPELLVNPDVPYSDDWISIAKARIDECQVVLVALSIASSTSPECELEIAYAFGYRPIVVLQLDPDVPMKPTWEQMLAASRPWLLALATTTETAVILHDALSRYRQP